MSRLSLFSFGQGDRIILLKKIAQRPEKIAQNVAQPFCYQS
jgi:hypothetical protein